MPPAHPAMHPVTLPPCVITPLPPHNLMQSHPWPHTPTNHSRRGPHHQGSAPIWACPCIRGPGPVAGGAKRLRCSTAAGSRGGRITRPICHQQPRQLPQQPRGLGCCPGGLFVELRGVSEGQGVQGQVSSCSSRQPEATTLLIH
jgi:hypothetical protein